MNFQRYNTSANDQKINIHSIVVLLGVPPPQVDKNCQIDLALSYDVQQLVMDFWQHLPVAL